MISKDELRILIDSQTAKRCLSLYMPTVRAGVEVQQNPIRFKNMLRTAEERLVESGLRRPEARGLLEPMDDWVRDDIFWTQRKDGLALFCSPELLKIYHLPISFEEQVFVGYHFIIKPLLPLFNADGRFYILALSQNQVRLLEGTRFHICEVDLEGVPKSMSEALATERPERYRESHPGGMAESSGGRLSLVFHGNGPGTMDELNKPDILLYFRMIDHGLQKILAAEKTPLVLAGVEYLHPIYREANHYQHLITQSISGNPDDFSAEELHQQAWELVQPIFKQEMEDAKELYRKQMGMSTGKASSEVREIVPAAYYGRVEQLFLQEGQERWGSFDPDTGDVSLHQEDLPSPEDMDVLDFTAAYTLIHHGMVYVLHPDQMPGSEPAAAIFRY